MRLRVAFCKILSCHSLRGGRVARGRGAGTFQGRSLTLDNGRLKTSCNNGATITFSELRLYGLAQANLQGYANAIWRIGDPAGLTVKGLDALEENLADGNRSLLVKTVARQLGSAIFIR